MDRDGPIVVHFLMRRYKLETISKEKLEYFVSSWRVSDRGRPYLRYVIDNYNYLVRGATGLIFRDDLAKYAS